MEDVNPVLRMILYQITRGKNTARESVLPILADGRIFPLIPLFFLGAKCSDQVKIRKFPKWQRRPANGPG